jgi:hypothetical protein
VLRDAKRHGEIVDTGKSYVYFEMQEFGLKLLTTLQNKQSLFNISNMFAVLEILDGIAGVIKYWHVAENTKNS